MNTKPNTSKTASLPQPVVEQLDFLSKQQAVEAIFVSTIITTIHPCIVVVLNSEANAVEWRTQKWVKKAYNNHGITFLIYNNSEVEAHRKNGTPFFHHHIQHKKNYYTKDEAHGFKTPFVKTKKRLKKVEHLFYREVDVLSSLIQKALSSESYTTAFNTFIALYEHYCFYLEWWVVGTFYHHEDLHIRLHRLSIYLPELQKAFIKSGAKSYYLIEALYNVHKAEQEDPCNIDTELINAIQKQEALLASLVVKLIGQHKKGANKKHHKPQQHPQTTNDHHPHWLDRITQHHKVEAVYQYHHIHQSNTNGKATSIYYCLIIGEGINNHQLGLWYEAIKQTTEGRAEVIPIAHTRLWIQKNLFENQRFFLHTMQPKFSIYQRHNNFPEPHWHQPYEAHFPDLDYYREACNELYQALQLHIGQNQHTNKEGFTLLFSSLILRTCRVIIYAHWSYYCHQLPLQILWRLAEAAHPNIANLQYLTNQLTFNWFSFLSHHQNPHNKPRVIQEPNRKILYQIAIQFHQTLNTLKQKAN